ATLEASLVTKSVALDDQLVAQQCTVDSTTLLEHDNECNSLKNDCSRSGNENRSLDNESSSSRNDADADIGPTYDSDTMSQLNHDMFENMFPYGIQNHEQPESIPDTYRVNKNNSNIISNIPNMDQDRRKDEHDVVDYEQQRAFFASLINNLKCDAENVTRLTVKLKKRMPY
ncbi:hypothetical protein Tco_0644064, partial [Tanacetum coccineum]